MRIPLARKIALAALAAGVLCAQSREKRIAPVAGAARESFERQPKVAVLAGVSNYPSRSGLSTLHYPSHDVDLVQAELVRQGYKVVALKDQEATRGSVRQALRDAAELVDRGSGTVLFFFSGHGFNENGANYLATFEATSGELAASGLAIPDVEALLKATGAPRQVMFIDACRNEPGKSAGARTFDRLTASAGMRMLFSTKAGKISYEDDQLGSGVFTHFLVRGLRGDAAGADGLVTFRDLADYVTDGVSAYGFQHGRMQVPYEAGESSGDFLLARAVSGRPTEPRPLRQPDPPGAVRVNSKDGAPYVWIPPGTFMMGCSAGDTTCLTNEKPAHQVTLSKGFWIGQTEVTQDAYQRVVGTNPSQFKGSMLPLDSVSWKDAQSYCQAVGMRLPTEAEWEYAARGGSSEARYGPIDSVAWYRESETKKVRQKQPNAFGLYDMLGNVWEWVEDWEAPYSAAAAIDPHGPPNGVMRVQRGGCWECVADTTTASTRGSNSPNYRNRAYGVRCAGEALPQP